MRDLLRQERKSYFMIAVRSIRNILRRLLVIVLAVLLSSSHSLAQSKTSPLDSTYNLKHFGLTDLDLSCASIRGSSGIVWLSKFGQENILSLNDVQLSLKELDKKTAAQLVKTKRKIKNNFFLNRS